MILPLLPLLSITATAPAQAPAAPTSPTSVTQAATEDELADVTSRGVRTAIEAGWILVSAESGPDEVIFTLTRGNAIARHIAKLDHAAGNSYRVEPAATLPANLFAPGAFLLTALAGGGGIELVGDCGTVSERPYLIERRATGAAAGRLVARSLAASQDVERATVDDDRASFALDMRTGPAELRVTLDAGAVTAAELRRYQWAGDTSTFRRQRAMQRAVRAGSVTSIAADDDEATLLFIGAKRFTMPVEAFVSNDPDQDETCGC